MTEGSLPGKSAEAYRTIGEAAEELKLPQHVLRFWETRFPQVKPLKRAGGRRFYRPEDVALLRAIKTLLYGEGYTIKGVQRLIQDQGPRAVAAAARAGARGGDMDHGRALAARQGRVTPMRDDDVPRPTPVPPAQPLPPPDRPLPDRPVPMQPSRPGAHPPRPAAADIAARLEAVAFDLGECERLLATVRASRG